MPVRGTQADPRAGRRGVPAGATPPAGSGGVTRPDGGSGGVTRPDGGSGGVTRPDGGWAPGPEPGRIGAAELPDEATLAAVAALGTALADLHRVLRRSTTRRLGRPSLPDAQVEVLRLVQRCPGISVREAAERLGSAANTVSTLVGDLADAGLLDRSRDPRNRRSVRLRLTPAAYDRIAEVTADRRDLLLAALDRLDEPARRDLLRAGPHLRRLVEFLAERERGEAARSVERDDTGGAEDRVPVVPHLTGGRPVRPGRGEG